MCKGDLRSTTVTEVMKQTNASNVWKALQRLGLCAMRDWGLVRICALKDPLRLRPTSDSPGGKDPYGRSGFQGPTATVVRRKVSELLGHDVSLGPDATTLSLQSYHANPNGTQRNYLGHHDGGSDAKSAAATGRRTIRTAIVYLSTPEVGGETWFPFANGQVETSHVVYTQCDAVDRVSRGVKEYFPVVTKTGTKKPSYVLS